MSFGMIPLSPDDKPDGFVLLSMYEKLESENAKLRDELDAAKHDLSLFSERIVELGAENAALRELLHEALLFGNERSYQEIRYRLKQQARELGVEVDE